MKVDARSERWREHRKKVRSEIVDAAFRAIDRLGPDVSLREIAEEAGTAKPKIYRHFTDKSDMFPAIGERMRDMLWAAIFPSINVASDPARKVIRRGVEQYVRLVDEHPNVVRFLIQGRFAEQSASTMRALNEGPRDHAGHGRHVQQRAARDGTRRRRVRAGGVRDLRAAASATDWWLGAEATARAGCRPTSSSRT